MNNRNWVFGTLAASALLVASPAISQSLQLGRDGIRVVPQEQEQSDQNMRSQDRRANDRETTGISERQAIRIAKGEGLKDVDSVTKTRRTYRVVGADRQGDDIRVSIDRQTGEVLGVK